MFTKVKSIETTKVLEVLPNELPRQALKLRDILSTRTFTHFEHEGHTHEDHTHEGHTHESNTPESADFKTSTSLGGGWESRPPAKWAQPYGLGTPVEITYSFDSNLTVPGLSQDEAKALFAEALSAWSDQAPLNFKEVPDPGSAAGIDIRVSSSPIDGQSNTLASAYFPTGGDIAGDITFDSDDSWSSALFLETAVHEIGHSLGLAHEEETIAIMNPVIANRFVGTSEAFLLQDDINGIVSLYGQGQGSVQPLAQPAAPPVPVVTPTPSPTSLLALRPRGKNLVVNGNFEKASVRREQFGVFDSVEGWTTLSGPGIQIDKRATTFGEAARGRAWAKLDSVGNSAIAQSIDTLTGQTYQLSFQYSPHQGVGADSNGIQVFWDGQLLDTLTAGGALQNQWQTFSYNVQGSSQDLSELSFHAIGNSDGVGGFIDNVIVKTTVQARAQTNSTTTASLGISELKEDAFLSANQGANQGVESVVAANVLGEPAIASDSFL